MLKKLRYGIVLMAAGLLLLGTVLATGLIKPKKESPAPSQKTEEQNTEVPRSEETSIADTTETETEVESGEVSSEEPETEPEVTETEPEVTEPEETSEVRDDTDKPIVYNPENETNPYTGLRGYFFRKLKINPQKVSRYLNVRMTPSPDGRIRMILSGDEVVPYIGMQGDWYIINYSGTYAYVHKNYVLTDYAAYLDMRDRIGFAAMVQTNMAYLWTDPNDTMSGVRTVGKSESFRVVGVTDTAYRVVGDFINYPYLYLKKSQAILYYMFLEEGDDNGLSSADFEVLAKEDVQENLERVYIIQNEQLEAQAMQESIAASIEAAKRQASIQESIIRSQAAAQDAAQRAAAQKALTFLEQQNQYDATHQESRLAYYYTMMDEAKQYNPAELEQITYTTYDSAGNPTVTELCRVTYYCHCTKCCGVWGHDDVNYVANRGGVPLIENYSVAVDKSIIPWGTRMLAILYNNDGSELQRQIFLAQDTGVKGLSIDVYRKTHTYCHKAYDLAGPMPKGMYQAHYYVKLFKLP